MKVGGRHRGPPAPGATGHCADPGADVNLAPRRVRRRLPHSSTRRQNSLHCSVKKNAMTVNLCGNVLGIHHSLDVQKGVPVMNAGRVRWPAGRRGVKAWSRWLRPFLIVHQHTALRGSVNPFTCSAGRGCAARSLRSRVIHTFSYCCLQILEPAHLQNPVARFFDATENDIHIFHRSYEVPEKSLTFGCIWQS